MPRILDVNYKEYESIPFWKEIVARTIKEYFVEIEGEHSRVTSLKITSIGQLAGKRFRIEIKPEKAFDKDHLSSRVIMALRDEEVENIAQRKIEEITDYLVASLRDEKIRELVAREHDDIRLDLESKFDVERLNLLKHLSGTDNLLSKKFDSYNLVLTKDRIDFDKTVEEVNAKLKGYDKLKEESTDVVENHKNFDGIALGVAATSMFTSLMIILFLLLG
jgi:hypothetical protein